MAKAKTKSVSGIALLVGVINVLAEHSAAQAKQIKALQKRVAKIEGTNIISLAFKHGPTYKDAQAYTAALQNVEYRG